MNNEFLNMLKKLIPDEYEAYLASLDMPFHQGFRINTLKISEERFFALYPLACKASKFAKNAYINDIPISMGNEVYHKQGLIYIQEASAASVVDLMDIQKGDYVLDMCAAPGGKSTQIAQHLANTGLLVSNEYDKSRVNKLLSNIERFGLINNCIINADSKDVAKQLPGFFDKILVDAPCSGEGMFKKSDVAITDWSLNHVKACAKRQLMILDNAYECLKENGVLMYSTCTINRYENEDVIAEFLSTHQDMELLDISVDWGRRGFNFSEHLDRTHRILPMDDGEGHFMAKFQRKSAPKTKKISQLKSNIDKCALEFINNNYVTKPEYLYQFNNKVYGGNVPFYDFKNLNLIRHQVYLGEIIKGRFEPSNHFYTAVNFNLSQTNNCSKYIELTHEDVINYFKGNTLNIKCQKGYVALGYQGINVGYGKSDGNYIKNKYPKGLRLL